MFKGVGMGMAGARISADICVIGAGSGGVAAAYAAARGAPAKSVLLLEAAAYLGGTSTIGGVNSWEPGCVGSSKLHLELYGRLRRKGAAAVADYKYVLPKPRLVAYVAERPGTPYEDTFASGCGLSTVFQPRAMERAMFECLSELKNLAVCRNAPVFGAEVSQNRIISVGFCCGGERCAVAAESFIDCTADVFVARMAGCRAERSETPNGVSQMFAIESKSERSIDEVPKWVYGTDAFDWAREFDPDVIVNRYPDMIVNRHPDGRCYVNTLPTISGGDFVKMGGAAAQKTAIARSWALFHELQKERGLDAYRITHMFPMLGVREGYRLVGSYVLTEGDVIAGMRAQSRRGEFVAWADHTLDFHDSDAERKRDAKVPGPYGVPYSCLICDEIENLAVACRGFSATSGAASSCRLQRTIMQLGEAAGMAAASGDLRRAPAVEDVYLHGG
jgi:hypothetical protein